MQRGTDFSAAEGGVWAVPGAAFGQAAWGDRDGEDGGDRAAGSPAPTRTRDYACALCIPCLYLGDGIEPDPEELDEILRRSGKKNACEKCKTGKKACDGRNPCGRCSSRGLECVFLAREGAGSDASARANLAASTKPGKKSKAKSDAAAPKKEAVASILPAGNSAPRKAPSPASGSARGGAGSSRGGKRKREENDDLGQPQLANSDILVSGIAPYRPFEWQRDSNQQDTYLGSTNGRSNYPQPFTAEEAARPDVFGYSAPPVQISQNMGSLGFNSFTQPFPNFLGNPPPSDGQARASEFALQSFGPPQRQQTQAPQSQIDNQSVTFPSSSARLAGFSEQHDVAFLPGFAENVHDVLYGTEEQQQPQKHQESAAGSMVNYHPADLPAGSLIDLGALEHWNALHQNYTKSPLSITDLLWDTSAATQPHAGFVDSLPSFLRMGNADPERIPGSWWPPLPTPPFVVSRPVSFSTGEVLPPDDVLKGQIRQFFEDYHPTFPVLHRQTFLATCHKLPHLLFAVCLLSTGFSSDPYVLNDRSAIEVALFLRCTRELRSCIDLLPEYHLVEGQPTDLPDDSCPETCLALGFVALWAYRRGYASLQQSVVNLALTLARRYGLAVDPGESSTFGKRTPRDAWVRREIRRKAWAIIWTLSEFISSITGKEIDDLAAEGRRHRIPPNDRQWEVDSEDPGFVPPAFDAPGEFRPKIMELVDWMDRDHAREQGIAFASRALETRSLVLIYLFGFLRLRTNQFVAGCIAAGVSPVDLQKLPDAGPDDEGAELSPKIGAELPFAKLSPKQQDKILRGLKSRAARIERNIRDILSNLPLPLRKAEAEGDAGTMIKFFSREVAGIPNAHKSVFARVLYLSQIRLFQLTARTSYGVLSFEDMGKLAGEWHMGNVFQECLESVIIYTRCLRSLLEFHPSLSYISITSGLFPLKIGAFHLAVLQFYKAHSGMTPALDAALFEDVERDLNTCLQFLEVVAANHSSAEWWASRIVDTLRQMANLVLRPQIEGGSPGYAAAVGGKSESSMSAASPIVASESGPTQVEVNQVYLRVDAPDAPASLGDG